MKTTNKLLLSLIIASTFGYTHAGEIVGDNSLGDGGHHIATGESNVWAPFGIHTEGRAGVASSNSRGGTSKKVDLEGLSTNSKTTTFSDKGQTVFRLHKPIVDDAEWWQIHRDLGSFNFVKVGNSDVWFGEWSRTGNETAANGDGKFAGRQVFYVGDKAGTTLPTRGGVTYTTYAMNKFTGSNLMKGELKANFNRKALSLKGTVGNLEIDSKINRNTASFKGTSTINNTVGTNNGHFFGKRAANLAGVAKFSNTDLNTSFGGTKKKR